MKLSELRDLIISNLEILLDTCKGLCRTDSTPILPEIYEDFVLEDCEFCLIKNLLDMLDVDSLNITLRNGNSLEFFRFDDAIVEVGTESATVINVSEFLSRVKELVEFNVITDEDAEVISKWFQGSNEVST